MATNKLDKRTKAYKAYKKQQEENALWEANKPQRIKQLTSIALQYFKSNPQHKQLVMDRAHIVLRKEMRESHVYSYYAHENVTKCMRCKQKWIDVNDYCKGYPKSADTLSMPQHICNVLENEFYLYERTIDRCTKLIKSKFKSIEQLTGADLHWLHTTHGADLEIVEGVFDGYLSKAQKIAYTEQMEKERNISKNAHKKTIITVKS